MSKKSETLQRYIPHFAELDLKLKLKGLGQGQLMVKGSSNRMLLDSRTYFRLG